MKDVTQGGLGARIVITGATGFIGSNLARVFLEHGDHVFALVRPGSRHRDALPVHDNLTTVECDLDHVPDCIPAIGRADAFLHVAWGGVNREEIDSPKVQARNVSGSLDCVRTAARLGCTVFMDAGSRVEYGAVEGMMQEDVECHPVNQYGKAKLEFYQKAAPLCGELNMNYYHLRFFSVYGYGDHPWSIISTLVRDLRQNKRVSLSACRHQWNFMYIEDAVQAVYELADATITKSKLDYEDGRQVYDIEWYAGGAKYDYEIAADTGEIISSAYEEKTMGADSRNVTVSEADAKKTALDRVSGATDKNLYEWKLDYEDGHPEYEGKIIYGGTEYEFTIDAATGSVMEWDAEKVR